MKKKSTDKNSPVVITVVKDPSCKMAWIYLGKDLFFVGNYHDFHPGCFGGDIYKMLSEKYGWHQGVTTLAAVLQKHLEDCGVKAQLEYLQGKSEDSCSLRTRDFANVKKKKGLSHKERKNLLETIPGRFVRELKAKEKTEEKSAELRREAFLEYWGILENPEDAYYDGLGEDALKGYLVVSSKKDYPYLCYGDITGYGESAEDRKNLLGIRPNATSSHSDILIFTSKSAAGRFAKSLMGHREMAREYGPFTVEAAKKRLRKYYVVKKDDDETIRTAVFADGWEKRNTDYYFLSATIEDLHSSWGGWGFDTYAQAQKALLEGTKIRKEKAEKEIARHRRITKKYGK